MSAPNVIVIFADDLGFSDVASFGGEIATPALDRLAERGVRMTSFSVTPRCSPSRAALLTGRHPHAVGVGILTADDRPHGYPGTLSADAPTLAERLKALGYATALAGKWHLSADLTAPNGSWPTRRGFDEFHGILPGCSSYYQPPLVHGEQRIDVPSAHTDYCITDDLSRTAVDFVERSVAQQRPFFLYLAYTAPHWPLHARDEEIARYRDVYRRGWDVLRAERFARQRELGLGLAVDALPAPDDGVTAWRDEQHRDWQVERMAVYAAQVSAMDRGIGSLLDSLDAAGATDDTLILFSSDNGACAEELPPELGSMLSEAVNPRATRAGALVRFGNRPEVMPGPEETYASYGRAWANLSNTPFRLYKRWVHEGGISSPCIVSWPGGGVPVGAVERGHAHLVDVVPTVLAAVGDAAELPGRDLLPMLRGESVEPVPPSFWEHVGNAAVRMGDWKLVREAGGEWELYDLAADRGETRDLARAQPERVAAMVAAWQGWADAQGVIPWREVVADYARRGKPSPG